MATPAPYRAFASALSNKEIDWDADTFTALLCDTSYTFNKDSHVYVSDITHELSGGSYARVNLTSLSIDSASSGTVKLKCANVAFASLTATNANYMIVFRNSGSDATSKLVCCIQFDAPVSPASQTVTFNVSSDGLLNETM